VKTYHAELRDELADELNGWLRRGDSVWLTNQGGTVQLLSSCEPAEHFTADERKITMLALRQFREQLAKARRDLIAMTGGAPAAIEALDERIALAESAREKVDHAG